MAINYTRLFTTAGKIVGALDEENAYRGTTLGARADTLSARFDAALQPVGEGIYPARDTARAAHDRWISFLASLLTTTLIEEVDDDRKLINKTLSGAVVELDRQMKIDGESLEDSPASITVTPSLTDGTALLVGTVKTAVNVDAQLAVGDDYLVSVPRGFLGGDTQYQETLEILGTREAVPQTSWEWPLGTGIKTTLIVRDPNGNNQGLTNGKLSSLTGWTQSAGDTWTVGAGTVALRSGYTDDVAKVTIVGAAADLQQTITGIRSKTVYAWTLKVYKHTSGTQTWDVTVKLVDDSGTVASSTTASSALSTGWNTLGGFFVTPEFLSGSVKLSVGYSGVVTGSNYELAHAGLVAPQPLYTGGPTLVAWAGTAPLTTRDKWAVAVAVGGTGELHRGINRLVNLRSILPWGLPVSGSATQADTLVS
jgi:hypothetical protein